MLTPRQKKLALVFVLIIVVCCFQMMRILQKRETMKAEQGEANAALDARWENMKESGTSFDKSSPLYESVQEYKEAEKRKELENQVKNKK